MRKFFALLLIASMPLAGVAQSLAPASNQLQPSPLLEQLLGQRPLLNPSDAHAVPLWGTPDGRILAVVSTGNNAPEPRLGAANEWRLIDVTQLVSTGARMRLGDRAAAHVDLTQSAVLAPVIAATCDRAYANCAANTVARGGKLRVGLNWLASSDLDLDFYYGLSWLRRNATPGGLAATGYEALPALTGSALPGLPALPGLSLADTQTSSINATGRLHLNESQAFDFGASLSRIQLSIPGAAPLTSLNQAAVSFGMEYGAFSGTLTGHTLGTSDLLAPGASHLTGVDIGLSWRTPWRGMFSVGAQNLWSSGSLPLAPAVREADQARVPYVQYRQDL